MEEGEARDKVGQAHCNATQQQLNTHNKAQSTQHRTQTRPLAV